MPEDRASDEERERESTRPGREERTCGRDQPHTREGLPHEDHGPEPGEDRGSQGLAAQSLAAQAVAPPFGRETDESLYHRVRRGDLRAFDVLYARYETRLFGFLCHLLRSPHDAEDLFHETFLSVLRSREVSFDRGSFAAWLYRVARNRALNHLRSGQRGAVAMRRLEAPESPPSAELFLIERTWERERAAALSAAVAALPDSLGELYRMRTAGLSYDEMAAALQIPLGTVKSRMNQMTTRLRRTMTETEQAHSTPTAKGRSTEAVTAERLDEDEILEQMNQN